MIVAPGEKMHIVERRYFSDDIRRHFIGEVLKCTDQAIRVRGYVWVFDGMSGQFVRKPGMRERVICLGDSRLIINIIPPEVDIATARYVSDPQRGLWITDGNSFGLEITEFTAMH